MNPWITLLILAVMPRGYVANPRVVEAIDVASSTRPLYAGESGPTKTAALLVAILSRESRFEFDAVGRDDLGESYGLGQIHESNLRRLRLTREMALEPLPNLLGTLTLIQESFRACRGSPEFDRLAMYAAGRGRCFDPWAIRDSRYKSQLAKRLAAVPPPPRPIDP